MFMQRIEVPVPVVVEARPRPYALKLVAGLALVVFGLIVMPAYLAAMTLWVVLAGAAKFAHDVVIHAGEAVVGR